MEPRPLGSIAFFLILALATISVTLRLNLLFISRVHPTSLAQHRARLYTYIAGAEALLALVMLACAALVAGDYDWLAAVLVTLAVVTVASLGIIEPATTSAAGLNWRQAGVRPGSDSGSDRGQTRVRRGHQGLTFDPGLTPILQVPTPKGVLSRSILRTLGSWELGIGIWSSAYRIRSASRATLRA